MGKMPVPLRQLLNTTDGSSRSTRTIPSMPASKQHVTTAKPPISGTIQGIWNGSAHSSHAYRTGLNLYFSFAVQPKDKARLRAAYHECWTAVMESCLEHQGTIAHHHGIGRVRREWLARELGSTGLATLRTLKHALDPLGIFNPGVLLPDVPK